MWIFIALLFGVFLWLNFHSRRHALRVLMYHKVDPVATDFLTVTTDQLRQHFTHLKQAGYQVVSLTDVLQALSQGRGVSLPRRAVLVTFDDAYQNNLTYALPLLQEFAVPATIFVATAFVGITNEWDGGTETILTGEQLKGLVRDGVQLAYHSHRHINYKTQSPEAIAQDLETNVREAARLELPIVPAFSYAYGGRPKEPEERVKMIALMERLGIRAAFRIGNRINPLPIRDPYSLNRIDIRGTDSLATFERKVKWGKLL